MRIKPIFIVLLLIIISENSCKDNTVGPGTIEPGRRDYAWAVDTLYSPMNDLQAIWGASPNDVWTIGPGGTVKARMFHFDGTKWSNYEVPPGCNGSTLFGFSPSDVWLGGGDGNIWHYNGQDWSLNFKYQPNGWRGISVNDIWGKSSNDIYAVGVVFYDPQMFQRGFVLHYDGSTWSKVYEADFYSQFRKIRGESDKKYIDNIQLSYGKNGAPDTIQLYELRNSDLNVIYSNTIDNITYESFNKIGESVFFLISQNVFRYLNGNFEKLISFNEPNFGYQIYGRSSKDIFIRMRDGLAHYNGTDVQYLFRFSNSYTSIRNVPAIFNKEIFFCVFDPINNINMVLHGKLK